MAQVDSLNIEIAAQANKAIGVLDKLAKQLDIVSTSLSKVSGSGITGFANGINKLSNAMQGMKSIGTADFTRLAKNVDKLSQIDTAGINRAASSLSQISRGFSQLSSVSVSGSSAQLGELAKGISQLGYKSATQAIINIPKLSTAMKDLMATLSTAPKVSQNLIDMTNALANLARTGASSGRAADSISKSFNRISVASIRTIKPVQSMKSALKDLFRTIAPYIGLYEIFSFGKNAIDTASSLTEVQNVIDVTFGKYADLVEEMSGTSIVDFGMSELTAKQISSRFQAMGTAMGFAQGKMADMSIDLTKLAGDMASFYNADQTDIAKSLQAIFTGETEPLRRYGLDLSNITVQEWALKQGLDANMQSMSQAEKTMLRYQYVMANTSAAQGDFERTADTWANQIRILKQNFEQLAAVIGGTLINALKPLVQSLNEAMGSVIAFAETVSNALGKIFGWKFQKGSGGAVLDDMAGASEDLAGGLGAANTAAKKLKSTLLGIDELNINSPDNISSAGGGAVAGAITGGAPVTGGAVAGQWVKDEEGFFESEIDSLYKLGEHIGDVLTNSMKSINWSSVYENASNFGTGLADFLNGLISPELFGNIGNTIASSLNSALYFLNSFGTTFDWTNFGNSIATGINDFFATFDFSALAETLNVWVDGIGKTIKSLFDNLDFGTILAGLTEFMTELDLDTITVLISGIAWKYGGKEIVKNTLSGVLSKTIAIGIGTGSVSIATALSLSIAVAIAGFKIGNWLYENVDSIQSISDAIGEWIFKDGDEIAIARGLSVTLGGLSISLGGVALYDAIKLAITRAVTTAGAEASLSGTGIGAIILSKIGTAVTTATTAISGLATSIGTAISGGVAAAGGIGGLLFGNIGTILGSGSLAAIGLTIGTALIGGIAAAVAGWNIGQLLYETITGEEVDMTFREQMDTIFSSFRDGTIKDALALWWEDIKLGFEAGWQAIVDWWNNTAIGAWWNENVAPWFSAETWVALWESVQLSWKTMWDKISKWWENTAIGKWWNEKVAPWFTIEKWSEMMTGVIDGFKETFKNAANAAIEIFNSLIDWINEKMHFEWDSLEIAGKTIVEAGSIQLFTIPKIPAFETGGFPEDGLFYANHNELVGEFTNGRTAVANNEMIVAGIEEAAYRGMTRALQENGNTSLLADIAENTRAAVDREIIARIDPDRETISGLRNAERRYGFPLLQS